MVEKSLPRVCIIILNWNGWPDTIECLASVANLTYPNFSVLVVDNGSTDDSTTRIRKWAVGTLGGDASIVRVAHSNCAQRLHAAADSKEVSTEQPGKVRLTLVESDENLGFAGGSNVGIRYALDCQADYIWLLNNDTTVAPNSLKILVDFLAAECRYDGATGEIRYYNDSNRIWNCGGRLTWYGGRKYYHARELAGETSQVLVFPTTFVTGCALLVRSSLFRDVGLLTERFFFGEEDIEFCRRLKRSGKRLACHRGAVIYHKVGQTTRRNYSAAAFGRIYVYYLNRFINQRGEWPAVVWEIWRFGVALYIIPMLHLRYGYPVQGLVKMYGKLLRESSSLDKVDRRTFEQIMKMHAAEMNSGSETSVAGLDNPGQPRRQGCFGRRHQLVSLSPGQDDPSD